MKIKLLILLWFPLLGSAVDFNFNFGNAVDGFGDMTAVAPVGGNVGTTLGEQRKILFQAAAQVWAAEIVSDVTIVVDATFSNLLFCDTNSAVLGSAGPVGMVNSSSIVIPNSIANTYYPLALANAMTGVDNFPVNVDIVAEFNSRVDSDPSCLTGSTFYYGLDGNVPVGDIAFFTTVLHELAHGLGFVSAIKTTAPDGSYAVGNGDQSIFDSFLYDNQVSLPWSAMSDVQRLTSMTNDPFLVWEGVNVDAHAAEYINAGYNGGLIRMYAPAPLEPGSSISHFSVDASPHLLMEPMLENIIYNQTDLTPFLFMDLGYKTQFVYENGFEN